MFKSNLLYYEYNEAIHIMQKKNKKYTTGTSMIVHDQKPFVINEVCG